LPKQGSTNVSVTRQHFREGTIPPEEGVYSGKFSSKQADAIPILVEGVECGRVESKHGRRAENRLKK
jgi:hypothetical protein